MRSRSNTLYTKVRIRMASGAEYTATFTPPSSLDEVVRYIEAGPYVDVTDENGKRVIIASRMVESVGEV